MKTTTKLFTLMILVFGFALIGASCGGDDSAAPAEEPAAPAAEPAAPAEPAPAEEEAMEAMEETPVRLAVFVGAKENTYWTAQLDAATARAEELGATVQGFGAEFDPAKQVAQLEDAIASGEYDAFVISSVDGQAVVPALEEAIAEGITVVCLFLCGPDPTLWENQIEGVVSMVDLPWYEEGRLGGESAVEFCDDTDPCNVIYLPGLFVLSGEEIRKQGVNDVLDQHDNITVIAEGEGGYLADQSYQLTKDFLQIHDDVQLILSVADQQSIGAEQALIEAGLENDIKIASMAASRLAVEALREGRPAWYSTVTRVPQDEAALAAEYAVKTVRGETGFPDTVNPLEFFDVPPFITQENANDFEAQWEG